MKRIAIEEHYTPKVVNEYLSSIKSNQPMVRFAEPASLEKRLRDMDDAGIQAQVISVALPGIEPIDPADRQAMSSRINDEFAEISRAYSGRFYAFAHIDPHEPEEAAEELERSITKLGLKGVMINSHTDGEYLDEEKYRVILSRAARLGVPIYIHPREPSPDMAKPYLTYPALFRERWGFAAEVGLHAMRLIFSGVFDEYPELKIIIGHMGEGLPYWLSRMDGNREDPSMKIRHNPSHYVKNNFFITNSGMFSQPPFICAYLALGADRIMFAVDYPFESNKKATAFMDSVPISDGDREKIYHLNAEKLLKL